MDFECMKNVVVDRHSVRVFSEKHIPKGVMESILGYSLRCPTSMNTQPHKMVVIRDDDKKQALSACMEAGNDVTVQSSPCTVIICADQEPIESVKEFGKFVYAEDQPPKIQKLMRYAFLMYYNNSLTNFLFGWLFDVFFWIGRLFTAVPARITNQAWSYQQCSFLIQDMVLLAQSSGISSLIMEGFNEEKVRSCVNLPKRYQIVGIISFGYEKEGSTSSNLSRFDFDEVIFDGEWKKSF